jgi:hypothetical protein
MRTLYIWITFIIIIIITNITVVFDIVPVLIDSNTPACAPAIIIGTGIAQSQCYDNCMKDHFEPFCLDSATAPARGLSG